MWGVSAVFDSCEALFILFFSATVALLKNLLQERGNECGEPVL